MGIGQWSSVICSIVGHNYAKVKKLLQLTDTIEFTIENDKKFIEDLQQFVGTSMDYKHFLDNPGRVSTEYFGIIELNKFRIYKIKKNLWKNSINLKIRGSLIDNKLILKINHPNKLMLTINHIFLFVFGVFILLAESIEIGLGILFITLIQLTIIVWIYNKRRNKFIDQIDQIIDENKN
jgi:hypothetical protein